MRKLLKAINLKSSDQVSRFLRVIIACLGSTVFALLIFTAFPQIAVVPMDINSEVMPTLDPLIQEVKEQWGSKLMIFVIAGAAVVKRSGFIISPVSSVGSVLTIHAGERRGKYVAVNL
jgi:hypothetical protein